MLESYFRVKGKLYVVKGIRRERKEGKEKRRGIGQQLVRADMNERFFLMT